MLGTINIGMSGLMGYSAGLRVIANNTTNLNTPGFKGSSLQFADLVATRGGSSGTGLMQVGYGLNTAGTALDFRQGELRQTGNSLDLAVDGQGLFTLRDEQGRLHYTRAGQFEFNGNGVLVNRSDGSRVLGQDSTGNSAEISVAGARVKEARATTTLTFNGNVSSTATDATIGSVRVIDALGGEHMLTVRLTNTNATLAGSWTVELMQGTTAIGSGQIVFSGGRPVAASSRVSLTYSPGGGLSAQPLTLDFSSDVTSFAAGSVSSLALASQDGYAAGSLTDVSFDTRGAMVMRYSNGQTAQGPRLLLGRFESLDAVTPVGNNEFDANDTLAWHVGLAGDGAFGQVRSGMLEMSNVDLSQEFSDLVIMQRGYQASSQVISTANDMLQELFSMKSK